MLGERLKRFRIARGMSLTALEAAIDHLVSSSTLSKYEKGEVQPSAKTLNRIAAAFGIKSAQLWGEPSCHVESIAFRKHTQLGKREEGRIIAFVAEEVEKRVWLQEQIPVQNTLKIPIFDITVKNLNDAEEAAQTLRNTLNVGIDPIGNLMDVLEDQGIYIIEIETDKNFDGISVIARDTDKNPCAAAIAIHSETSGDRQRLNLTHELGHLIMRIKREVDIEKAAFRFGGAFLAPAEQIYRDIGEKRKNIQEDELFYLKKKYGISIQAILFRLKDLGIITEAYYKKWCIDINKLGWKKKEPINIPPEHPQRFHQQVRYAFSEDLITKKDAKRLLNQADHTSPKTSMSERRKFLALPKKERHRILSEQAKEMADFYEDDTDWQEWEGGPVGNYELT